MECPNCNQMHIFTFIGTTTTNDNIYYTSYARSKDLKSPERFINFMKHLTTIKSGNWIWIFDNQYLTKKNSLAYNFLYEIDKLILKNYNTTLKKIIFINSSFIIKTVLKSSCFLISKQVSKKVNIISSNLLVEIINILYNTYDFKMNTILWLTNVINNIPIDSILPKYNLDQNILNPHIEYPIISHHKNTQ